MAIIVTGAGGFVGRVLVEALVAEGLQVVGVDSAADAIPVGVRAVAGDICAPDVRRSAFDDGCTALIHLATIPGGAAEADPAASRRVNIDAMYDWLDSARDAGDRPRVVFASSIAVFGDPLPVGGVDDTTPIAPKMIYGGHKAMMETAVAMMSNRQEIDGMSLRLPGILARPKGPSGMKSAFMSDLFHALRAGQPFVCPVSADGTIWAQSVGCCARNLIHGLTVASDDLPVTRAMTLPALRIRMGDLAAEVARQCDADPGLVRYLPDPALELAFATQPPLETQAAVRAGFADDGDLANLVASALATLGRN